MQSKLFGPWRGRQRVIPDLVPPCLNARSSAWSHPDALTVKEHVCWYVPSLTVASPVRTTIGLTLATATVDVSLSEPLSESLDRER